MGSISRLFASLLFCLFLLVAGSLAGSWELRHHLLPESAVAAYPLLQGNANQDQVLDRLESVKEVRAWTTAAQIGSLLMCAVLSGLGLRIRYRLGREALRREEAERELSRERRALENRIEHRTTELRQEVEERRRAEELNRGQKQVLEMLARPGEQKTEDILCTLARTVAGQRRVWQCTLHLVDRKTKTLRLAGSSELDEKLRRNLLSLGTDLADAPESRACASGEVCIVEKMTEVRRPWSELLVANGIFAAWSLPFRADASGDVTGTVTIYSRLQYTPTPRDLELLETAANLAALVVEHRRIHGELVDHAYRDVLTGLPNRRAGELAISTMIEQAARHAESLAVLWIDLDRFKRINDQFGHEAGDIMLREVAQRLRAHTAERGSAARMGGDEFLVLVPGLASSAQASEIAEELAEAIAQPIDVGTGVLSVSGSVGISLFPRDGSAMDILQRNADVAMYRAKAAGSGICIYSPAMDDETKETLAIEAALREAIDREAIDPQMFELVYQPVYRNPRELGGFEALLRFHHPKLGNVSPARFIPIAEEMRLIDPIGTWVLEKVVCQLKQWQEIGAPPVRVSVNISALQFVRDDFAETVAETLARCGVGAEFLTLELTESAVMDDYKAVVRQMNLLRALGVSLAIDDFGTGHSSLSYLHKLPIDVLKIDRSFVERLDTPESTRPIVEAVISMARHLDLMTVAEGVETGEQRRILLQAGCSVFQGYLFGRPMRAADAEGLLLAGAERLSALPEKAAC